MEINVTSKFNLGDRVWVPELYADEWYVSQQIEYHVSDIAVFISSDGTRIIYTIKNSGGVVLKYPEETCFSNYSDCEKWCKEHA